MLMFDREANGRRDRIGMDVEDLFIAGWAGRDDAAVRHHIEELAALGVPRPSSVPVYYRVSEATLTQSDRLTVLGPDSSGEAEPVLVSMADGLWLGIGSDHTDRKAEAVGVALSKQMCGKPIGRTLWRFEEVEPHLDGLTLRSYATIDGQRVLYQEGQLSALRHPRDLLARRPGGPDLPPGSVMFCGTLGAIGAIRPAGRFEIELQDDVLGRTLRHSYDIVALPVVS